MPSRASHSKSRHGCAGCKARRVKCDENRPICSNCDRHNRPCEYLSAPSNNTKKTASVPLSWLEVQSRKDFSTPPSTRTEVEDQSSSSLSSSSVERWFSTQDLELFFHYTVATSHAMAPDSIDEELWQIIIPREAYTHSFLMCAVLSLAALHKAHLHADDSPQAQNYNALGILHDISTMALIKAFLRRKSELDSATADAITCSVVVTSAVALARLSDSSMPELNDFNSILDTFKPIRTLKEHSQINWEFVESSPMGLFLFSNNTTCTHLEPRPYPAVADLDIALQDLEWRVQPFSSMGVHQGSQEENDYSGAVRRLRNALHPYQNIHLLTWPFLLSTRLVQAMRDHDPAASIILGFFGMALHVLRDCWWIGNAGRRIVDAVMEQNLPAEWRTLLRWAIVKTNGRGKTEIARSGIK